MQDLITIDIVIINWNSGDHLRHCIDSLRNAQQKFSGNLFIGIVDNSSTDYSMRGIENVLPEIRIMQNSQNAGFGTACNQGAKGGNSDYILFLNPDTTVNRKSIVIPFQFLQDKVNRNYAACSVQMTDDNGTVIPSCDRFPHLGHFLDDITGFSKLFPRLFPGLHMKEWDHKENRDVDHVIGAFYFVRRSFFEELGGFDERFFVYWEDMDLSKRIHEKGWKIRFLADASCYHKGGGTSDSVKATRLFYFLRSKILYGFKHLRPVSAYLLLFATLLVEPLTRLIFTIPRPAGIPDILKAYGMLYRGLPDIIKTARH